MISFLNDVSNKINKIIYNYSINICCSFFASNYLYNKLNNKIGITIERFFNLQYIFLYFSFTKALSYIS